MAQILRAVNQARQVISAAHHVDERNGLGIGAHPVGFQLAGRVVAAPAQPGEVQTADHFGPSATTSMAIAATRSTASTNSHQK